jgi:hypothetical protein
MTLKLFRGSKRRRIKPAVVGNAGVIELELGKRMAKLSIAEAVEFESALHRAISLAELQRRVMRLKLAK